MLGRERTRSHLVTRSCTPKINRQVIISVSQIGIDSGCNIILYENKVSTCVA